MCDELHLAAGNNAGHGLPVEAAIDDAADLHRTGVVDDDAAECRFAFDGLRLRHDGLAQQTDITHRKQPELSGSDVDTASCGAVDDAAA